MFTLVGSRERIGYKKIIIYHHRGEGGELHALKSPAFKAGPYEYFIARRGPSVTLNPIPHFSARRSRRRPRRHRHHVIYRDVDHRDRRHCNAKSKNRAAARVESNGPRNREFCRCANIRGKKRNITDICALSSVSRLTPTTASAPFRTSHKNRQAHAKRKNRLDRAPNTKSVRSSVDLNIAYRGGARLLLPKGSS